MRWDEVRSGGGWESWEVGEADKARFITVSEEMVAANQEMDRATRRWNPGVYVVREMERLCLRRYLGYCGYEQEKENTHCVAWLGLESRLEVVTAQDKRARVAKFGSQGQPSAFAGSQQLLFVAVSSSFVLFPSTSPGTRLDNNTSMLPTATRSLVLLVSTALSPWVIVKHS